MSVYRTTGPLVYIFLARPTLVSLNPVLERVVGVASAIINHEQTPQNRVCCFQTLDNDLFSDYSEEPTFLDIPKLFHNVRIPPTYECCNKTLIDSDSHTCCPGDARRGIQEHYILKGDSCCGNCKLLSFSL